MSIPIMMSKDHLHRHSVNFGNLAACALGCLLATGATADPNDASGKWDTSISGTTDYIARGQSQTSGGPAVQLFLGWSTNLPTGSWTIGPYANIWASNVDFNDASNASVEVDYHIGVTAQYDRATLDLFAIYYAYPGSRASFDYDYMEAGIGVNYDLAKATVGGSFYWSPDYFGGIGESRYYSLDASVPLNHGLSVTTQVGYNSYESANAPNYTDWSVTLGKSFSKPNLELTIAYVDSDLNCGSDCDAKAVFTITKQF